MAGGAVANDGEADPFCDTSESDGMARNKNANTGRETAIIAMTASTRRVDSGWERREEWSCLILSIITLNYEIPMISVNADFTPITTPILR